MPRVIGRLPDLQRRARRADEQRLADLLRHWSLDQNHAWVHDGVQRQEPFLQISAAPPGSVLAWELAQLHREGYVAIGPFWVPRRWLTDGDGYRRIVRLVAAHVGERTDGSEPHYVPKVAGELDALLAMWPYVLLLPTSRRLSCDELLRGRAWPVHALGVVARPSFGDGAVRSPAEFFAHDLDHARYKVREDLAVLGHAVPDPYVDGGTFDPVLGRHRAVMASVVPRVTADGWQRAASRALHLDDWCAAIDGEPDRALAEAARWLLFELLHEKSLPVEPAVLVPALASGAHTDKLRQKGASRFFGAAGPSPHAIASLDAAAAWLATTIEAAS